MHPSSSPLPFTTLIFLYFSLTISTANGSTVQGMRVQALQQQITQSANMDFSSYKLYPFAISNRQQFSLYFSQPEIVRAEVKITWIELAKNQLTYPIYDQSQYVKLSVVDCRSNRTVQERKFHFQTGISFEAEANTRYRLRFTDFGKQNKMVQLAISRVQPSLLSQLASSNPSNTSAHTLTLARAIESQLTSITRQTERTGLSMENVYRYMRDSLSQFLVFSAWEVCLVGVMMLGQVIVFGAMVKNNGLI